MGFFDNVATSTEKKATNSLNAFKLENTTAQSTPQTTRPTLGGTAGAIGNVLVAGQYAAMSAIQTAAGLEKDKTFVQKFAAKPTGKDVLRQIGEKFKPTSTIGKLTTGTYEPSQSVLSNFFKEIPSTFLGIGSDIAFDPLTFLGGMGLVKRTTEAIGKGVIKPAIKALGETSVGAKVIDLIGRGFVPRYNQPELFKALDRRRLAEEQMIASDVGTLVDPILKQNAKIQEDIANAIKGGFVESKFLQPPASSAIAKGLTEDEFVKAMGKTTDDILYRGSFGDEAGNNAFMTDYYGQAAEYASDGGKVSGFRYSPKDVLHISDSVFNDIRGNYWKNGVSPSDLRKKLISIYKEPFSEGRLGNAMMNGNRNEKQVLDFVEGALKKGDSYGDYSKSGTENDLLVPLMQDYAAKKGKNIISFEGGDYALYGGGQNEFVVRDISKLSQLRAEYQAAKGVGKESITNDAFTRALAEPIRAELDRVGAEIAKFNPKLLDPATFEGNKGTYFPRMFEKYEVTDPAQQIQSFFSTGVRPPKGRFMTRKDLPDEILESLGEIKTAGYPAAKGLTQLKQAETRSKFFKEVADNFSSDLPSGNLIQLPESKYLGALSGKFVLPSIAEVVNGTIKTVNPAIQMYLDGLAIWKTFKTAYNPATIARNDLTNLFVLNPLGGVPFWDVATYAKTTKEMLGQGPIYQAARKAGLDISNQSAAELTTKASILYEKKKSLFGQFFSTVKDFHRAVANFYGTQDKFFKLANIIKSVEKDGLSIPEALNKANFYLIDYSEMPEAIDMLRKTAIPFISFTYGVSRPLAKTLLERPDKLANYFKVLQEIQQMNPYQDSQDQKLKEYDSLPQYIKEGQFEKLPIKDATGRSLYLDLQYILPFNPIESKSLAPNNPLYNIFADLQRNKSGFTDKKIWNETDTLAEKNVKALQYMWLQLAPNNPLVPNSWSFNKMQDAGIFPRVDNGSLVIEPRPDSLGRERSKMMAVLDSLFGIKLTPIDVKTEEAKRGFEKKGTINDLKTQLFKLMLNKQMLPADKEKQKQNILDKIKKAATN